MDKCIFGFQITDQKIPWYGEWDIYEAPFGGIARYENILGIKVESEEAGDLRDAISLDLDKQVLHEQLQIHLEEMESKTGLKLRGLKPKLFVVWYDET